MFKCYRVLKKTYLDKRKYVIEKRFLGFLWWYKFLDVDFDTYEDAAKAIHDDATECQYDVVTEITFNN